MSGTPWRVLPRRDARTIRRAAILFGRSYEDERVELAAFTSPGRVCVIAASGETVAACAAAGHQVTAVDINAHQLAYARRRVSGEPAAGGVAEAGMAVGRAALRRLSAHWRLDRLLPVLATAGPQAAADHWRDNLAGPALRIALAATVRPATAILRTVRPAARQTFASDFDRLIVDRLSAGLARHGMAGNRFAWRLLAGVEDPSWRMPAAAAPIDWLIDDVCRHLEAVPAGQYAGISLSNVLDGASTAYAIRLLTAARRATRPGGAIVLRSFGAPAVPALAAADHGVGDGDHHQGDRGDRRSDRHRGDRRGDRHRGDRRGDRHRAVHDRGDHEPGAKRAPEVGVAELAPGDLGLAREDHTADDASLIWGSVVVLRC